MEMGRALSFWNLLPIPLFFRQDISISDFWLGCSHSLYKWRIDESICISSGPNRVRNLLVTIKEYECSTGKMNGASDWQESKLAKFRIHWMRR